SCRAPRPGPLVLGSQALETRDAGEGEGENADGGWRIENGNPSSILHLPSSPHPRSRHELAGRRGDHHARAAAAAGEISRCPHRAAHAGKTQGPLAASSGGERNDFVWTRR